MFFLNSKFSVEKTTFGKPLRIAKGKDKDTGSPLRNINPSNPYRWVLRLEFSGYPSVSNHSDSP
jgi:hypothetical protein